MERSAVPALDIPTTAGRHHHRAPLPLRPGSRSVWWPSQRSAVVPGPGAHAVGDPLTTLSCKEAS